MKRPFIIGIGGAHSGSGKTPLAAALLKHLTKSRSQIKEKERSVFCPLSSVLSKRWGAIKFTKTAFYASVTDDRSLLARKGKDTNEMLEAGAEEVLWVQSPAEDLEEVLPMAIGRLSHLDGIVVEGNSAIEFLKPDIVIFLEGVAGKGTKPSAEKLLKQADIIIARERLTDLPRFCSSAAVMHIGRFDEKSIPKLVEHMEKAVRNKAVPELLKKRAADNMITCTAARKIAEELGVPYKEVGKAANELKIKIKNCELGCF